MFLQNYKKKFIKKFMKTKFMKKKMNSVLIKIVSFIIRLHINSLLCYLINFDMFYLDFTIQIFISILTTVSDSLCFNILYLYNKKFYEITKYFINNYTEENIERWVRNIVLGINFYFMLILYFVNINSKLLIIYSIQYLICFFLIDYFEKEKYISIYNFYNKLKIKLRTKNINVEKIDEGYLNVIKEKVIKKNIEDDYEIID